LAAKPQRAEKDMASAEAARPQFGVPFFERAYGWVLVRVVAMLPVETLLVRFKRVSDTLLADFPGREASGTRRVSVKRFVGIEESSRNWSGAMLLEHLAIVGRQVNALTEALCAGHPSSWVLQTRDVKPTGALTRQEAADAFEAMVRAYVELVRSEAKAFRSPMRHPHPWFGELRVKQWLAFMTLHHMVHVPHMKAISAKVGVTDTSQAGS
jgi:DinB family protein